jgi:hypothetical protein
MIKIQALSTNTITKDNEYIDAWINPNQIASIHKNSEDGKCIVTLVTGSPRLLTNITCEEFLALFSHD